MSDKVWRDIAAWLIAEKYIYEFVELGAGTLKDVAAAARHRIDQVTQGRSSDSAEAARVMALSAVLADGARRVPRVVDFRRDVLDGQVMAPSAVQDWAERQAVHERAEGLDSIIQHPDGGVSVISMELPVSLDTGLFVIPVPQGGTLDRLNRLADDLATDFGWQHWQAAAFVLTDVMPLVPTLVVKRPNYQSLRTSPGTAAFWAARIVITVDPDTPAEDVAEAYREVQREVLGGSPRAFATATMDKVILHSTRPGRSWLQLWTEWARQENRAPKPGLGEPREQANDFARVVKRARHRLLRLGIMPN